MSQIAMKVPDEDVVLHMQFEDFSWIQMQFCCEKEQAEKNAQEMLTEEFLL